MRAASRELQTQRRAAGLSALPWATFAVQRVKCGGESCFDFFDAQVAQLPVWRSKNLHIVVLGRPNIRIRRAKEENAIGAGGCREMRNSAIMPDECRARKDRSKAWQRQVPGETNIAILPFAFQSVRLSFVCLA